MRLAFPTSPALLDDAVSNLNLNLRCRDELIPILRALQHLYQDRPTRQAILDLVAKDANGTTSPKLGRKGLDYWSITVLAAVRLGCNLNYDKLQDLAEQHRNLRLLLGITDAGEEVTLDWRRIQDNITLLKPQTLQAINQRIVALGHQLAPEAVERIRVDTFVTETNIHYPTESSLIGDGLRKVVTLAATLASDHDLPGWRQHQHLLNKVQKITREINRLSRAKKNRSERLKTAYQRLLDLAQQLLQRAKLLWLSLNDQIEWFGLPGSGGSTAVMVRDLQRYLDLTERVCDTARRRVLLGEKVANEEKLFSIFEPHTELIHRGKQPDPIQYGHRVLVVEDAVGFLCHYQVVADGVLDQSLVVPLMKELQQRFDGKIKRASFDRGFHTPENQKQLAALVSGPCLAKKGSQQSRQQHEEGSVEFRQARQHHPGVESVIGALQSGNGQDRCRDKSKPGYDRYVGLGMLGRNLQVLGKLLLSAESKGCEASKSKRKKQAA